MNACMCRSVLNNLSNIWMFGRQHNEKCREQQFVKNDSNKAQVDGEMGEDESRKRRKTKLRTNTKGTAQRINRGRLLSLSL